MDLTYDRTSDRPVQIGLAVLQSDETLEMDMRRLLPADVEILVTRVPSGTEVTQDSLQAMENVLTQSVSLFPQGARLSAVGYGCTSGTAQIGPDRISKLVKGGIETPQVTEPVSALIAACKHLQVTRIGLLSPYIESVSARLKEVLADNGIAVTHFASFNEPVEENVVRISGPSIVQGAVALGQRDDCEAVFLSCTNLRTLDLIDQIETRINKPTLSSNQVLAWHLGELALFDVKQSRFGRLLAK